MSQLTTIITHDGNFHADDVFAVAALMLFLKEKSHEIRIIRTRDLASIETGDYVVDVGGEYIPDKNRFDHHQYGGAGSRDTTIPYAAFGLVWKKYGKIICDSERVADSIDVKLVQPIDAIDNGIDISQQLHAVVRPYFLTDLVHAFFPSWKESATSTDAGFKEVLEFFRKVLAREIIKVKDALQAEQKVLELYYETHDKRIIILDEAYPIDTLEQFSEPLLVIRPNLEHSVWKISTLREHRDSFKSRRDLPVAWAGKQGKELQDITGITDALFCHNKRFTATAHSREGAIQLAKLALNS